MTKAYVNLTERKARQRAARLVRKANQDFPGYTAEALQDALYDALGKAPADVVAASKQST